VTVSPSKQAHFLVQPETLLRGPRELLRLFTEAHIESPLEKAEALAETIRLIKEMSTNKKRGSLPYCSVFVHPLERLYAPSLSGETSECIV
jgi:hypothetical protein